VIKSFVTLACFTRASTLTAVLNPSLLNLAQFSFYDRTNLIQFARAEAVIRRKLHGFQPKLARHSFTASMNMSRLVAVEAIKIEPVWSGNILDRWHGPLAATLQDCGAFDDPFRCPANGSTFSRKPRENTTANSNYPHARIGGCNVVLALSAQR
jgi:hypothetical protein